MMLQTTYEVTQKGKTLSCEKIVLNKYENRISILKFNIEESLANARLYVALLNPITNRYTISPLSPNNEITLSSGMTIYPGIWEMILLATEGDYEISDDNIDNSKLCYVSDSTKRIIVRDNFLDESQIELEEHPAIQQLLDETVAMRDTLETYALGANEDCNKAMQAALEAVNSANVAVEAQESVETMAASLENSVNSVQIVLNNITSDGDGAKFLSDDGTYYEIIDETEFNTMLEEVLA